MTEERLNEMIRAIVADEKALKAFNQLLMSEQHTFTNVELVALVYDSYITSKW